MDDLISRQDAIDKVEMLAKKYFDHPVILRSVRDMIEELPSAQPERKTGKWILDDEYIDCSACRHEKWSRVPYESLVKRFNFCPNCGADMRGERK